MVGFIWGFICQQFAQTVYILGAGVALACLVSESEVVYVHMITSPHDNHTIRNYRALSFKFPSRLNTFLVLDYASSLGVLQKTPTGMAGPSTEQGQANHLIVQEEGQAEKLTHSLFISAYTMTQ